MTAAPDTGYLRLAGLLEGHRTAQVSVWQLGTSQEWLLFWFVVWPIRIQYRKLVQSNVRCSFYLLSVLVSIFKTSFFTVCVCLCVHVCAEDSITRLPRSPAWLFETGSPINPGVLSFSYTDWPWNSVNLLSVIPDSPTGSSGVNKITIILSFPRWPSPRLSLQAFYPLSHLSVCNHI